MQPKEFKAFRKKLEKTQKQMAQLLGVSLKAIHSYEQGWRTIPGHVERQFYFLLVRKFCDPDAMRPCWEVRSCTEEQQAKCPAVEFAAEDLCWFINGTICDGTVHKSWSDKMELCRTCDVFKKILHQIK